MEPRKDLNYEKVEEILAEADLELTAAELQATLCGMISAGLKLSDEGWQDSIAVLVREDGQVPENIQRLINDLAHWTEAEMQHHDLLAPTLLPDEDYPAVDQLEAITLWCQGFLLGFGLQTGDNPIENTDVREAIADLADISQLMIEADDDEETQEALFTVAEHIRVAVQVIYWEIVMKSQAGETAETPKNETIH
ncbi:UPF0149 family protein [Aliikangiella sp. G2MR2-5]|uniref:UPF0149 family protein n=1 Tax=Aliikangiella sp. G2MR2-5 TaxID=2788943 RepID=UPI0018A941C3|nr:UPF0149 family protein [Aliikangiella sp. G2MR2-5]